MAAAMDSLDVGREIELDMFGDRDDGTGVKTPPAPAAAAVVTGIDGAPKKSAIKRKLFDDEVYTEREKESADDDYDDDDDDDYDARHNDWRRSEEEELVKKLKIRPDVNRFACLNEIIDMTAPLPGYQGASVMFTNIYNTFVYIVKLKNTLLSLQNRKLTIQLLATEYQLRKLEEKDYVDAHVQLPRVVESLFSMWDYQKGPVYINQLKPISCVLNKKQIADYVGFRSMEAVTKNESQYIEVMFNNPYRFIFIGSAGRVGQYSKNAVSPFPFFGEYINKAIADMYDVLYEKVTKEIRKAKTELTRREQSASAGKTDAAAMNDNFVGGLQSMEAFSNSRLAQRGNSSFSQDDERLRSYLRRINLPLDRRDNVEILITSGNSGKNTADTAKMRYLSVEKGKEANDRGQLKIIETDVAEDAVYLSSYIRCRVLMLDVPTFTMQIYTKHAIKLMAMDNRLVKFSEFNDDL